MAHSNLHAASQRIKILQVLGNAIVGGMETYVARLIERLPADRFGVTAMVPFDNRVGDQLRAMGVEVFVAPMPENPPWTSIQTACEIIRMHGIDVLHAHLPNAHLLSALAGKLMGKPVVTTIHGRQLATLDLEVHRTAGTHLSAVCRQTYFHALGMGVAPSHLHLIPNGVDTDLFKPRAGRQGRLRAMLGLAADVPLIGQVGRLSPEKGPDVFIRAALSLKRSAPHAHFVFIGDGPLRSEMAHLIERFELQGTVHLAGLMEDMPEVYGELDVAVTTSRSEAMPLALMEAMASGLPVIATRVGGIPDMIDHCQSGWLVGDGDYDAIAAHLQTLLDDPDRRAAMGGRARERALSHFSLDQSVALTTEMLTRLAQQRAGEVQPRRVGAVVSGGKPLMNANGLNGSALNGNAADAGKAATA